MAALQSGYYTINFVDYTGGLGNVKTRPIGVQSDGIVVLLPEGAPAPRFLFESAGGFDSRSFSVSLNGGFLTPEDGRVVVRFGSVPHAWFVLRSAPHPPPVGTDAFSIFTGAIPGASAWNPGDGEGSTPITLKGIGYPFWIARDEDSD